MPRTLGAPALFAASYGNVGSSIYYALGVTAAYALGLTPLALLLAGFIFVTTALNYAEGTAAIPHAGGSSSFARRAFNDPIGFLVGWVQLLNYMATVSISAYFAISYLGVFGKYVHLFDLLKTDNTVHVMATMALIGLLIVINVIGIQESSALNLVLAFMDLITQVVLVILGLILILNIRTVLANIHLGVAPTWGSFLASVSIAMVTYTGIETISNLSEEARNPGRSVPRATNWVILAVLFVAAFLPTIGLSALPVLPDGHGGYMTELATTYKSDPVVGIVTGFAPRSADLAFWASIWVGILAFTILVIATNAGLIGISRLSYSLAGAEMMPRRFATLHAKFKTPYISIVVFGLLAALLVLPGVIVGSKEIDLMSAVYSLAATFAFASAHLSVMRLRFVEPELYRPYRMPLNIKFGRDSIPILSLVGALAIGTVFTQLMFQNISNSTWIYLGWLLLGVLSWVFYRTYRREPLWEPLEVPPPPDREVEHLPPEPLPQTARYRHGRRERILAHAAKTTPRHVAHRRSWRVGWELYFKRHGNIRGMLIVLVFASVSGLAIGVDLSSYDPFGTSLGWSPGIVVVALIAAYLLNRSHLEV